jgi:hypothetical protein
MLIAPLIPEQQDTIDKLLELRKDSAASTLAWLRHSPDNPVRNPCLRISSD